MEAKVVILNNVKVIARGCAESCDCEATVSGRAIIAMYEPETVLFNNEYIKTLEELPEMIGNAIIEITEGACMLVEAKKDFYYITSDGEYGHIFFIPKEWLKMLGYKKRWLW